MGRLSTSLLAALLAGTGLAQSFGRFSYASFPAVPGFRLSAEGFRSSSEGADTLRFASELKGFKATEISDRAALYVGPEVEGMPSKVRVNLRSPGFELYFPKGLSLRCTALQSPFLSWKEGSVGPNVPAPRSPWILVSFLDKQPPLLLAFLGAQVQTEVTGTSGAWTVQTKEPFSGWVRVCLPLGNRSRAGTDAASLGQIVQEVVKNEAFWVSPTPTLIDFEVRPEESAVTAVWTFDRAGALVPVAAVMARIGGYPIEVKSGIRNTEADLTDGPVEYTTEAKLVIRFPIVRVPVGRPLGLGPALTDMIASASPFDVPSLCDLALSSMLGCRDALIKDTSDTVLEEFLAHGASAVEPFTQEKLPYLLTGGSMDLAAAHALVTQCRLAATGRLSEGNEMLGKVLWKRDWYTWLLWCDDQAVSRRASALTAVTGAFCQDPSKRLEAAMLQAGLASERALVLFRERRFFPPVRKDLIEPLYNLRTSLFGGARGLYVDSLMSEVRIVSDEAVTAEATPDGVTLRFKALDPRPGQMAFEIARPVSAIAVSNIKSLVAKQALGRLVIDYEPNAAGECVVLLRSPGWSNPLPPLVAPPRYSEG